MSEETALIVSNPDLAPKVSETDLAAVASSATWLPRVQLMTNKTGEVAEGKFPANHYALVRDQSFTDLGMTIDVLVCSFRTKAMEFGTDGVNTVYDPKPVNGKATGEFARIMAKSELKDSGAMFGLEYLIYLPQIREFATLFMGTKSTRRESAHLNNKVRKGATLGSKFIKTPQFAWTTIEVKECSQLDNLPSDEEFASQVTKFNNPEVTTVETIDEGAGEEGRAR